MIHCNAPLFTGRANVVEGITKLHKISTATHNYTFGTCIVNTNQTYNIKWRNFISENRATPVCA